MGKELSVSIKVGENDNAVASVKGRIDSLTHMDFLAQLDDINQETSLTLDIKDVNYMSSAGIRAILSLAKKHTKGFFVINASEFLMDTFKATGLNKAISITPLGQEDKSRDAAHYGKTFSEMLAEKVSRIPDKAFVVWQGREYTWRDIDVMSQIIAKDLWNKGVKRFSYVAVSSEDSPNLVCTFFAIQKLGAIAVMLNPAYTAKEIAELSKEGDITHFCYGDNADEGFINEIISDKSEIKEVYYIGRGVDFKERYGEYDKAKNVPCEASDADDPAVMIFTSGSTGTPKGALHSFYSMSEGGAQMLIAQSTNKDDRLCHTLPLFHIGGWCFDFMNAFLADAVIYMPCLESGTGIVERMNVMLDTVYKNKCTIFNAVPTTLLSVAGLDTFSYEKIKTVKGVATGSQPITEPQMRIITEKYKNAVVSVFYGMTEIMPATFVQSAEGYDKLVSTVGKPVKNIKIEIMDGSENPCPLGKEGEIYLMGDQAIACYYKMGLEKQPVANMGYIKTGDLGFVDNDGYLHISGRIKDIIIRGGENIVPGEIA